MNGKPRSVAGEGKLNISIERSGAHEGRGMFSASFLLDFTTRFPLRVLSLYLLFTRSAKQVPPLFEFSRPKIQGHDDVCLYLLDKYQVILIL
jgi:hypothetical protein